MKKSLVALAVLAASGASFAQSSVTMYGVADVWLGSLKASQVSGSPDSVTLLNSGGVSGSRWGIKGSEDLGGGLKAVFDFEQGVAVDTGAAAGFNRLAYVGFAGGFGQVTFGNVATMTDDLMGASNSGFDSGLSATNGVWVAGTLYSSNPTNAIKYTSPSMGGFSFGATYALDEKAGVNNDVMDFGVSYAGGPLAANFAYQVQKSGGSDDLKIMTVNGSYDFAVAKLLASYAQTKFSDFDVKDYQIGVDFPVSSALTLSAGYAHSKRDDLSAAVIDIATDKTSPYYVDGFGAYRGTKNTGFGFAAAYSLSKRTTMYGGISTAKGETAGNDVSKRQLYAVGVKHTF